MPNKQTYTTLWCQRCGKAVDKVDPSAHEVICHTCVYKRCMSFWNPLDVPARKASGKPPGWHWRTVFVAKDGTVYHKGKEQPKLKGTLKPTKFEQPKKRKKKLSKIERWEADTVKLASRYKEKKKLQRKKLQQDIQKQKDFLAHNIDKG